MRNLLGCLENGLAQNTVGYLEIVISRLLGLGSKRINPRRVREVARARCVRGRATACGPARGAPSSGLADAPRVSQVPGNWLLLQGLAVEPGLNTS